MRNLPQELCQKVGIHQLAEMQFQIRSHHMQRLSDSMLNNNRYLGPDHSRTWEYLMGQGRDTELPFEQDNQPDCSQSDPPVEINEMSDDLSQPSRKTRSGRLYATTSYVLPKPILSDPTPDKGCQTNAPDLAQVQASARAHNSCKLRGLASFSSHLGTVSGATAKKQHVPTKIEKSISWDQELTIRFQTIIYQDLINEDIQEYKQVCINQDEVRLNLQPTTYVMTSLAGIDASPKEFLYCAYYSNPVANTIQNEEILCDDLYD